MKIFLKNMYDIFSPWLYMAVGMNILRLFLVDSQSYIWLNWNLFLALVPLLFLYYFKKSEKRSKKIMSFFAWLFFLPNATYLLTDLIHLRDVGPEWLLWYDGMMIFSYALVGIAIFAFSLDSISKDSFFIKHNAQKKVIWTVSFLSAFGIYLGRYIRWNTWDIITKPFSLIGNIFEIIFTKYSDPTFLLTLIFFTLLGLSSVRFAQAILNKE